MEQNCFDQFIKKGADKGKTFTECNLFNKLKLHRILKEKVEKYYIKVHMFYLSTNDHHANFIALGLMPVTIIIVVNGNSLNAMKLA